MTRRRKRPLPTQARLRELFDYHPDGYFVRRIARGEHVAGQVYLGSPDPRGYSRCSFDGNELYMHQAIFLWHHGFLPQHVDHDDRDKGNNRIANLLESSASPNGNNRGPTVRNRTGVKGVFPTRGGRFRAQRTTMGRANYLGVFDTLELAAAALEAFDQSLINQPGARDR